jgi:hypothetical protein
MTVDDLKKQVETTLARQRSPSTWESLEFSKLYFSYYSLPLALTLHRSSNSATETSGSH